MAIEVDIADRNRIEDCLRAYTRGIDRLDAELIRSAFHRDAELEGYGRAGTMTIDEFVDRAIPSLRDGYRTTQHRISNTHIEPRADGYWVETYVIAFHVRSPSAGADGVEQLLTFNGRYIDRFEHRDGDLRIAHRALRKDWSQVVSIDESMPGDYVYGTRDRNDVSYPA